jgi:Fe-S cluster assembly ATPase SufC
MKRYQVYLNPHSVSILDEVGKNIDISRSKILQTVIDYLAQNMAKMLAATKTASKNKYILDSLVGSIKLPGNRKTSFARDIDDMYLKD